MAEPADAVGALFAPFHDDPGRAGVFTDFDGTLSAIVDDPAAAGPVPGAIEALGALVGHLGAVWVVSGRPVDFLAAVLPPGVHLSGLYGLETSADGEAAEHPEAASWRRVVDDAADEAAAVLVGVGVERKGLALTLHFRGQGQLEEAARTFARDQAVRTGLEPHDARMSIELRPPIRADKGTVVAAAAASLAAACFIGDDRGDLPAFDALDRLGAAGTATVRVAVRSPESPAELLDRADLVVEGPPGVVTLLRSLGP